MENKEYLFLRDNYYSIKEVQTNASDGDFIVSIRPESRIFEGHFPGDPICPGVCNIEIIRECACLLTGKELNISSIRQCRFTTVARPEGCPALTVHVTTTENPSGGSYTVDASISDADNIYVTFRGELVG